jgi:CSLREA domain-containing protein
MNAHSVIWKRLAHLLAGLILVLAVFSPVTGPTRVAHATGPFEVDTPADGPDSSLGDGICSDGGGHCSLRAAIQQVSWDLGRPRLPLPAASTA